MRGGCLCGTVEFEISGPLPRLYHCHCSLCRKQTGSAFNSALCIRAEDFRWVAGQDRISSYVASSGYRTDSCALCASPLPNPLRGSDYVWVPAGLLAGDLPLVVGAHICVGSKAVWDEIGGNAPQFEHVPDFDALIELLHGGA